MMRSGQEKIREHSRRQQEYFETTGYRTLHPTGSPYLRRHVDKMMKFADIQAGRKVLEVGCGMGRYTMILKELGVDVEGLDLSDNLLEEIRKLSNGRFDIPLHAHDILDCPAEMHGQYDAVIGFFVLHHVHEMPACIEAAAKLVKPGGRVAFVEPNPWNPLYYFQIFFTPGMRWRAEKGLLQITPETMLPLLRGAELQRISFERFGFFPPFITNRTHGPALESAFERFPLWKTILPFQMFGGVRA